MASFAVTLEDSSPLISYAPAGAWVEDPATDTSIPSYSATSMHTTSSHGATATIHFNGTGIAMYGAMRPNYGTYEITVDGNTIASTNASSSTPLFNQTLGAVTGLPMGQHTAVLTNTGSDPMDIDWVQFETQIGLPDASLSTTVVDDGDPRIQFSGSDWQTTSGAQYYDQTTHFTSTPNAQAMFSFSGEAVAVYGTVSPDHSDIRVSVDGAVTTSTGGAGGFVNGLRPKTLLYYANNLDSNAQHNLVFSADTQNAGPYVDLDNIVVYSSSGGQAGPQSGGGPASKSTSTGEHTVAHHSSVNTTTLIGIVAGVGVALLLLLALLVLLWRRVQSWKTQKLPPMPMTPALPIQTPSMMEAGLSPVYTRYGRPKDSDGVPVVSRQRSVESFSSITPILGENRLPRPPEPVADRQREMRSSNSTANSARFVRPSRPPSLVLNLANYDR